VRYDEEQYSDRVLPDLGGDGLEVAGSRMKGAVRRWWVAGGRDQAKAAVVRV
jgi:hypothetical protein